MNDGWIDGWMYVWIDGWIDWWCGCKCTLTNIWSIQCRHHYFFARFESYGLTLRMRNYMRTRARTQILAYVDASGQMLSFVYVALNLYRRIVPIFPKNRSLKTFKVTKCIATLRLYVLYMVFEHMDSWKLIHITMFTYIYIYVCITCCEAWSEILGKREAAGSGKFDQESGVSGAIAIVVGIHLCLIDRATCG